MKKMYNAPRTKVMTLNATIMDSVIANTSVPGEPAGDGPVPADLF